MYLPVSVEVAICATIGAIAGTAVACKMMSKTEEKLLQQISLNIGNESETANDNKTSVESNTKIDAVLDDDKTDKETKND